MTAPRLTYFDFRGLGEPIRLIFADAGAPLDERRVTFETWGALQPSMPFGQMPLLEADGLAIPQSHAICRWAARRFGLYGQTPDVAWRADVAMEALREAQTAVTDHFWSEGSLASGAAATFAAEALAPRLATLARWFGAGPWWAGDEVTFADHFALNVLDEIAAYFPTAMPPALGDFRVRMQARPGIAAYIASGRQPPGYGFDPLRGIRLGPEADAAARAK